MKVIRKIIDVYLVYPITIDIVINIAIWVTMAKLTFTFLHPISLSDQLNIIAYLIGTMVSLAGFLLAALTIIVTFKSSIKAKGLEDANNALELIFSTPHYKSIVKVFKDTIIEFLLYTVYLFIIWQLSNSFDHALTLKSISITTVIIFLGAFRSLFILFTILNLEFYKKEE